MPGLGNELPEGVHSPHLAEVSGQTGATPEGGLAGHLVFAVRVAMIAIKAKRKVVKNMCTGDS